MAANTPGRAALKYKRGEGMASLTLAVSGPTTSGLVDMDWATATSRRSTHFVALRLEGHRLVAPALSDTPVCWRPTPQCGGRRARAARKTTARQGFEGSAHYKTPAAEPSRSQRSHTFDKSGSQPQQRGLEPFRALAPDSQRSARSRRGTRLPLPGEWLWCPQ